MSLLTVITLLVGIVGFALGFLNPNFPFSDAQILAAVLFVLGLGGIVPTVAKRGLSATWDDLLHSYAFWFLVAGLVQYVASVEIPNFPYTQVDLVALAAFVLSEFGIILQLKRKGVLR